MSTEEQKLDAELRRKAPQTEPYMPNSGDLNRWPEIAPDLQHLDGYVFTGTLGRAPGRPSVFNLRDKEEKIALYPVMPGKKAGDFHYASQEELIAWKKAAAGEAGLPIEAVFFGPAYHDVETTITLGNGETFPVRITRQDFDYLALYTERKLP